MLPELQALKVQRARREQLVSMVQRVPSVRSDQREPTERPVLMAPRALLAHRARLVSMVQRVPSVLSDRREPMVLPVLMTQRERPAPKV